VKPIIFHRRASEELEEAAAYYEELRAGLGLDLMAEIADATRRIQQQPRAYSPYKQAGVRKYVARKFPYNIFYRELDDVIWIMAVAHAKRRPDYWTCRKIPKG
jgi:toxin ParE1/3/4